MSKIVAGTAFVLLGGATVAGGVLLHKGSKSSQTTGEEQTKTTDYDSELPDNLKDKLHEEKCVTGLFGTQSQFADSIADLQESDATDDTATPFFSQNKPTSGCLVVNWDKRAKDNKWSGNFRFLWAVQGETKGFIVFLVGSSQKAASGDDHKISWQGRGYVMESSDSGTTWSPKKKSSSQNSASLSKTETDTSKFPQPGPGITAPSTPSTIPTFWGWISGAGDLAQITDQNQPADGTNSSLRSYWEWSGQHKESPATNKKLSDWTKDFDTWWSVVFGQSKLKAKDISEKQEGTWTNRHYKKLPESSGASA